MRRGQHAADDGSFGRSAGGAMARGIALIVVAVLLGVILLRATDAEEPFAGVDTEDVDDDGVATPTTDPALPETTDPTVQDARDPSEVTVLVANGAGINGLASRISDQLKAANYVTAEPTDTRAPADESVIYFTPGYEAEANAIAALLDPQPRVEAIPEPLPVEEMGTAQVLVVAAADLAQATG